VNTLYWSRELPRDQISFWPTQVSGVIKSNVIIAAIAGVILGIIAELFFVFVGRMPVLGCLAAPVALLFGLGLPVLVGALAAALGSQGVTAIVDGAVAALLAQFVSGVFGFCASLFVAQSYFFGPSFLLPTVAPAARTLFTGVWELGWLVIALAIAAILGALGGFLYDFRRR
jgi:hypothetical protein